MQEGNEHAQDPPVPPASAARGFGLVTTNLTKLSGLGVAINESLVRGEIRPAVLALAAFMMAGAQGVESFLDKFLGR